MQFRERRCCIALAPQCNAFSTHAPWRTQEPQRSQDRLEWVLCPETERGSRTLQSQVESTDSRRVVRRVPDEPSIAGKLLRLWHFGREDKRPHCREVLFPNLKVETAPARRPWPGKNRENCAECRNGRARSAIAVSRHQRKPNTDRPRTLLGDHKQKLSAATDVVEQTDMLLANVARSSPGCNKCKKVGHL